MGFALSARVSPVWVSLSLATAPMSPAWTSGTWVWALPCSRMSEPTRSAESRGGLWTGGAGAAGRGRGSEVHDRVEDGVDTGVQEGRGGQHREDLACSHRAAQPLRQLLLGQRPLLEELLHELLVALRHHLHELLAPGLCRALLGGGEQR